MDVDSSLNIATEHSSVTQRLITITEPVTGGTLATTTTIVPEQTNHVQVVIGLIDDDDGSSVSSVEEETALVEEVDGTSDDSSDVDSAAIRDLRRQIEALGDHIFEMEQRLQEYRAEQAATAALVHSQQSVNQQLAAGQTGPTGPALTTTTRHVITTTIQISNSPSPPSSSSSSSSSSGSPGQVVAAAAAAAPVSRGSSQAIRKRRSRYQKVGSQKSNFHKYMRHYMNLSYASMSNRKSGQANGAHLPPPSRHHAHQHSAPGGNHQR